VNEIIADHKSIGRFCKDRDNRDGINIDSETHK
jgi:hypothetical protein